jgi:hypothetical protein
LIDTDEPFASIVDASIKTVASGTRLPNLYVSPETIEDPSTTK